MRKLVLAVALSLICCQALQAKQYAFIGILSRVDDEFPIPLGDHEVIISYLRAGESVHHSDSGAAGFSAAPSRDSKASFYELDEFVMIGSSPWFSDSDSGLVMIEDEQFLHSNYAEYSLVSGVAVSVVDSIERIQGTLTLLRSTGFAYPIGYRDYGSCYEDNDDYVQSPIERVEGGPGSCVMNLPSQFTDVVSPTVRIGLSRGGEQGAAAAISPANRQYGFVEILLDDGSQTRSAVFEITLLVAAPEPSSPALLAAALLCLNRRRRQFSDSISCR